ncbi:MAG: hypothetical protein HRT52_00015 [Colwellia sp.]|nr:hypothetical protein [Colwellia sp.]
MINNYTLFNSNHTANTNTRPSSDFSNQVVGEKQSSNSIDKNNATVVAPQKNLHLSSRAEKLNALSNEFFKGGALTVIDVNALVERTYELGFISKNDYLKLSENSVSNETDNKIEKTSSTTLIDYINEFKERLDKLDDKELEQATPEEKESLVAMIKSLNSAQRILSDVEEAKRLPNFKSDLKETILIFKDIISSQAFNTMALDDKVNLTNITKTLEIVDQLSPQRLNNKKVDQYIEISLK